MNYSDLVQSVAEKTDTPRAKVKDVIDALGQAVRDELGRGGDVTVKDLGKFQAVQRKERTMKNPRTGEPLTVPASRQPKFKAAQALRSALGE